MEKTTTQTWRAAWEGAARVDITISLANAAASAQAAEALGAAIINTGGGYTRTQAVGAWEGGTEEAHIFSMIAGTLEELHEATDEAIAAAHASGCEAVQVETWGPDGYRCYEAREAIA